MNLYPPLLLCLGWLAVSPAPARALSDTAVKLADAREIEFFEAKIRPVLVKHCYQCHSHEARAKKKLRGGLLLDSRDGLRKGGDSGRAVVPGKAPESLLLKTLHYDGEVRMPPRQKLPDAVIIDFETWINRGATDPRTAAASRRVVGMSIEKGRRFWAYRPVSRLAIPRAADRAWPRGPIDAFVLAALEAKGLLPAPEAERAVLARRLYYDLLGLPPSPEQVDAFVFDPAPDAYERLVDRLLASPHFGERWGRHWLDVARFAESLTLRGFILAEAWRYRDYVIDTFNGDAPFDRFVREQVAGDLLPVESGEQRRRGLIATAFLALGNTNLEEQDKKQLRMDVVDEQLDAIGRAFLAQTLGCARCHDHKFDPIPTRDYYALAGILRNTKTLTHANVSMWLEVPLPVDPVREKLLQAHDSALAALERQITTLRASLPKGIKTIPGGVRTVESLPGIVVDDTQAKKVGQWNASRYSGTYVGAGYIHDDNAGKGEKTVTFQPKIPATGKYEVRLAYSAGSNRASRVPVTIFSADGEKTVHLDQRKAPDIDGLFVSLGRYTFERSSQGFVLVANEGTTGHVIADAVVFVPVEKADADKSVKADARAGQLHRLEEELRRVQQHGPRRDMALSVREEPVIEDTNVHIRGSVHTLGEKVRRGFLQVASSGQTPMLPAKASGRRELADWLARSDNPLTARVFVNRAWHWLFGAGLVRTTDNFGAVGERPSHPELLDHLAFEFVESGWSIKKLVRAIVLSNSYRQSVTGQARSREADPENRLLSRANRRRLDAECIRDTILAVSGNLTLDHGGPSYKAGLRSDYGYKHVDTRRSVYTPVFRNTLPELFEVFDFADPSVPTGVRNVSTSAPQALFSMNHSFVIEQAHHAARRLLAEPSRENRERIIRAYRLALGRPPADGEVRVAEAFLAKTNDERRAEAWARLVQVIFASVDFRYVE
jgi:hypothetical protein